ncbi:hypothetical protein GCM10020367_62570 [Streptomyces sannanensis]|uniref:Uncharacterized protein n=1 Tax=Streptomyces sannanensis TaxID=285536 RepID=A0ABP6SME0_9ACTN
MLYATEGIGPVQSTAARPSCARPTRSTPHPASGTGTAPSERGEHVGPQRLLLGRSRHLFGPNITLTGGPAPVRTYIDELLPDVLDRKVEPGRVFDRTIGLEEVPDGYRAMDQREALKVLVRS